MRHPPRTAAAALLALALLGAPAATASTATASAPPRPTAPSAPTGATGDSSAFLKGKWGDDTTGEGGKATALTGSWTAGGDLGSMNTTTRVTGAQDVWAKPDPNVRGGRLTGQGVTVAVIDTGIAPVEGLATPGKVVNGPDLSYDSQAAGTRYVDGFGHGTHLAGIVAGRDTATPAGAEKDQKYFVGMAPDARLLNMKVGSGDGGTDVSQVVAAVDWVVEHKAELGVRVLNLSYGTDTIQGPGTDPLAHAVENAWRAGIVVVVAAGNEGVEGATRLTMPAVDPYVLAVGSTDHQGSVRADDLQVGPWTNRGTAARMPDLVAPGKSVVSLRVPGSYVDLGHPEGLVYGETAKRMFRGTGTSQSAAVVSGAAALLVQRNPTLTPDQVKGLLKAGATRLPRDTNPTQGAGRLDVKRSVELLEKGAPAAYAQTWTRSAGTGSLDMSRGSSYVTDPSNGAQLRGEKDALGAPWNPRGWSAASTAQTSWVGGSFNGRQWSGSAWSGTSWSAATWTGLDWSGRQWSGRQWSAMTWSGRQWSAGSWSGRQWSSDAWSGRQWSGSCWGTEDTW